MQTIDLHKSFAKVWLSSQYKMKKKHVILAYRHIVDDYTNSTNEVEWLASGARNILHIDTALHSHHLVSIVRMSFITSDDSIKHIMLFYLMLAAKQCFCERLIRINMHSIKFNCPNAFTVVHHPPSVVHQTFNHDFWLRIIPYVWWNHNLNRVKSRFAIISSLKFAIVFLNFSWFKFRF